MYGLLGNEPQYFYCCDCSYDFQSALVLSDPAPSILKMQIETIMLSNFGFAILCMELAKLYACTTTLSCIRICIILRTHIKAFLEVALEKMALLSANTTWHEVGFSHTAP